MLTAQQVAGGDMVKYEALIWNRCGVGYGNHKQASGENQPDAPHITQYQKRFYLSSVCHIRYTATQIVESLFFSARTSP